VPCPTVTSNTAPVNRVGDGLNPIIYESGGAMSLAPPPGSRGPWISRGRDYAGRPCAQRPPPARGRWRSCWDRVLCRFQPAPG
jgi:hypothetical protein